MVISTFPAGQEGTASAGRSGGLMPRMAAISGSDGASARRSGGLPGWTVSAGGGSGQAANSAAAIRPARLKAPGQLGPCRAGRRDAAEIGQAFLQRLDALGSRRPSQPMAGPVNRRRRLSLGLAAQVGQLALHPAVSPHEIIVINLVQRLPVRLQPDQFLAIVERCHRLARTPQPLGRQPQNGGLLRRVFQQRLDFREAAAIGGELRAQPVQQRVAEQLAGPGHGLQLIRPPQRGDRRRLLAVVPEHLALHGQRFGIVGLGGQPPPDLGDMASAW